MGPKKHPLQTAEDQAQDAAARRRLQRRLAQARYKRTAKGQATQRRYNGSQTRVATNRRYRATTRGQQTQALHNQRRLFIGAAYHGRADTLEQAAVIQSHIKERLRAFSRFSSGT